MIKSGHILSPVNIDFYSDLPNFNYPANNYIFSWHINIISVKADYSIKFAAEKEI